MHCRVEGVSLSHMDFIDINFLLTKRQQIQFV